MDFRPSQEQLELQQAIRLFCEEQVSLEDLRRAETTQGFDDAIWRGLSALGVFQVDLAESDGGLGLGRSDAVLVFEELGRALAPGPIVFTALAAGLIDGAASGEAVVGGLDLREERGGPLLVAHWESLDQLLVLRREGVRRISPADVVAQRVEDPLDPLTPIHSLSGLPDGEVMGDAVLAESLALRGRALLGALSLGIAGATLDLAVAYAKEREQFDRPIGSFQSIKHMLADMFARQELARGAVYAAGATLDFASVSEADRAVCAASICSSEAAMKNARACIQIHGGMGFTWEVAAHYFLKRCWVLENVFGAVDEWSDRLASELDVVSS